MRTIDIHAHYFPLAFLELLAARGVAHGVGCDLHASAGQHDPNVWAVQDRAINRLDNVHPGRSFSRGARRRRENPVGDGESVNLHPLLPFATCRLSPPSKYA